MILKGIVKLAVALNNNKDVGEIAGGAAFGLMLALVPAGNLLWLGLLVVMFLVKVNSAVALLFLAVFKALAPLADPALDPLGYAVLTAAPLAGVFGWLANLPVVPFTRFNNSLVMGGLLAGIVLWVPFYLLVRALASLYRRTLKPKIENSRLYKAFRKLPLVSRIVRIAAGSVPGAGS